MDPEELKAKRMANLKPFSKNDPRINRAGRKPGVKNWSKIVQDLLGDEELLEKILPAGKRPEFLETLPNKNAASAIVAVMVVNAIKGDQKSAEWLRKTGFGDKLLHEFEDGLFQSTKIEVEIVKPKITDVGDSES